MTASSSILCNCPEMSMALPPLSPSQQKDTPKQRTKTQPRSRGQPVRTPDDSADGRRISSKTQSLCLDLLTSGFTLSYIDLFRILHPESVPLKGPKSDLSNAVYSGNNSLPEGYTLKDLNELKSLLTKRELSTRLGDKVQMYESKKALGVFYNTSVIDLEKSAGYLREAYECASTIHSNKVYEMEAAHLLGSVLAAMGQAHEALKLYEQSRILAVDKGDSQGQLVATKSLVNAKVLIAQEVERAGNFAEAISQYRESIEIVQQGKDVSDSITANELCYFIGNAYKRNNEVGTAIEYLNKYLDNCKQNQDFNGSGKAQLALASCYESSGNLTKATAYLKEFIESAGENDSQKWAVSQACNQIGILLNKVGDYEQAVKYSQRHFALECGLKTHKNSEAKVVAQEKKAVKPQTLNDNSIKQTDGIGAAQIQLGLSMAHADMGLFFDLVVGAPSSYLDLSALLAWKEKRVPLSKKSHDQLTGPANEPEGPLPQAQDRVTEPPNEDVVHGTAAQSTIDSN